MLSYRVCVAPSLLAHVFEVALEIPAPLARQRVSLPVWIPGSYLVREFARHLFDLQADQGGSPLPVTPLGKASWCVDCTPGRPLRFNYRVYAHDASVRAAFLDNRRGFFNGTSLFLQVEGAQDAVHRLRVEQLPAGWQVATAMPPVDAEAHIFEAVGYDAFVDHPVELSDHWTGEFTVRGVPHRLVVTGALPDFDGARLISETARICEAVTAFWHGPEGEGGGVAPFGDYLFLLNAVDDGYGGLEHRASTALIANRRDLPQRGRTDASDGHVTLLGLISHEYFHAWNVKRLRPAEFARYDYTRENHTSLLWFFEGFTSYADDLLLLRAGLIDAPRYLQLVAKTVAGVLSTPGRRVQSLSAASHDAWTKYYRADENTPNATVSYYGKGALVGLMLDLSLRSAGAGTGAGTGVASLDLLLRRLWTTSGAASGGGSVTEHDIVDAVTSLGGEALGASLRHWVHGTDELPLQTVLAAAGVRWTVTPPTVAQRLGVRASESALTGVRVTHVLRDGAAERAGLSAGDEVIAVDDSRLRRLDDAARLARPGETVTVLVCRDQRLLRLSLQWPADGDALAATSIALTLAPGTNGGTKGGNNSGTDSSTNGGTNSGTDSGTNSGTNSGGDGSDDAALALRRAWIGG